MAVLLSKAPSQKETVNDLHGDLTNLARVIQQPRLGELLYDRLQRALICEGLLEEAQKKLELPLLDESGGAALDRAYWYFLACWTGRNGTAGTERQDYQIAVRWTKNGGSPAVRFRNAVESIPAWHQRLRNVVILRRNAFEFIDRFEDHEATAVYLDPPYHASSRTGWRDDGSENRYLHEFSHSTGAGLFGASQDDHGRLRDAIRHYRRARIVVSYYDCPEIRRLYEGWTFTKIIVPKRGAPVVEAPEVLIANGESHLPRTADGSILLGGVNDGARSE